MIIFGWREKPIHSSMIANHSCNHCNTPNSLFAQITKVYVHVFWIPFIPLAKKAYSVCSHCKQSLTKNEMPPDLQQKIIQVKQQAKNPVWLYAGLIILGLVIGVPTLLSVVTHIFK